MEFSSSSSSLPVASSLCCCGSHCLCHASAMPLPWHLSLFIVTGNVVMWMGSPFFGLVGSYCVVVSTSVASPSWWSAIASSCSVSTGCSIHISSFAPVGVWFGSLCSASFAATTGAGDHCRNLRSYILFVRTPMLFRGIAIWQNDGLWLPYLFCPLMFVAYVVQLAECVVLAFNEVL